MLRREAFKLIVVSESMDENCARDVRCVRGQSPVVGLVDFLCECILPRLGGDDTIADRRYVRPLPKARNNFFVNRREARVDVMKVNRGGVQRLRIPEISD